MKNNSLLGKQILGLEEMPVLEMKEILQTAQEIKSKAIKGEAISLKGKAIVFLFSDEHSLLCQAFTEACRFMGASVKNIIIKSGHSMDKGKSLRQVLDTVSSLKADAVIVGDSSEGTAIFTSRTLHNEGSHSVIINGGDGGHENPIEALAVLLSLLENKKDAAPLKMAMIGDALHSGLARSLIYGLSKLGSQAYLAGPSTLVPKELEKLGCTVTSLDNALEGADAVQILPVADEDISLGLIPSQEEYSRLFGMTSKRLGACQQHVKVFKEENTKEWPKNMSGLSDFCRTNENQGNLLLICMAVLYATLVEE